MDTLKGEEIEPTNIKGKTGHEHSPNSCTRRTMTSSYKMIRGIQLFSVNRAHQCELVGETRSPKSRRLLHPLETLLHGLRGCIRNLYDKEREWGEAWGKPLVMLQARTHGVAAPGEKHKAPAGVFSTK